MNPGTLIVDAKPIDHVDGYLAEGFKVTRQQARVFLLESRLPR
jgi:hypothetical protein